MMNDTSLASVSLPHPSRRPDLPYALLPGLILFLLLIAFGSRSGRLPSQPWHVHLHAVMFIGWIVLVTIQATLIRSGAVGTHRKIGAWGMAMVPFMFAIGIYSAIEGARHGHNPARFSDALAFMAVPLMDITLFATFMLGAWWARRRATLHKRLVMLAMVGGFAWPIVTRLPMIVGSFPAAFGALALLVMILPLASTWNHRRVDWLSMFGGMAILLSVPLRRMIGESAGWHEFARWVIS